MEDGIKDAIDLWIGNAAEGDELAPVFAAPSVVPGVAVEVWGERSIEGIGLKHAL
jgi:hypothetical protein